MSASNLIEGLIREGAFVTIVEPTVENPTAYLGVIETLDPLHIRLNESPKLSARAELLMIVQADNRIVQAKGHVERATRVGDHTNLEISHAGWVEEDRRRHPRFSVDLEGRLVSIREGADGLASIEADGRFKDISLSGGWFATEQLEPRGSLVRWQLRFEDKDHPIRGLALVARSCPKLGGMGLEFVEFYDGDRELLRVKLRSLES